MVVGDVVVIFQRLDVFVEIRRPRRAATQRVHFRPREAVKVVEHHRRQRRAQVDQLLRRLVKFAALVVRADDEHAHVALARRHDGRPVEVVDEIPVEVDVIEFVRGDGVQDDVRGRVGGKADEPDAAFALEFARGGEAAVLSQREIEQLPVVDAVQREQINVVELQILHRFVERLRGNPSGSSRGATLVWTMILSRGRVGSTAPSCISDVP